MTVAGASQRAAGRLRADRGSVFGAVASAALLAAGCGGGEAHAPNDIAEETAETSIRRVGTSWSSSMEERGTPIRRAAIVRYRSVQTLHLTLTDGERGRELVRLEEELELATGQRATCTASGERTVSLAFGRRRGEPAVEVVRPRLLLRRSCQGGRPPDPVVTVPAERVRFVLRADQLVPFEPAGERRVFLPE
ncbi:MAG: hypothetical protein IT376_17390 [Polyangiaceae bacterium]|nr:hypothetical protein [Polyangiaceae bacterium]